MFESNMLNDVTNDAATRMRRLARAARSAVTEEVLMNGLPGIECDDQLHMQLIAQSSGLQRLHMHTVMIAYAIFWKKYTCICYRQPLVIRSGPSPNAVE